MGSFFRPGVARARGRRAHRARSQTASGRAEPTPLDYTRRVLWMKFLMRHVQRLWVRAAAFDPYLTRPGFKS
jgi:hypothetical protein